MRIYEKEFSQDCFCGSYAVGTNGFKGGDSSVTRIELNHPGGSIATVPGEGKDEIIAQGDAELRYLIEALEWIVAKLKQQTAENFKEV